MCYREFMNYDIASQILLSVLSGLGYSRPENTYKVDNYCICNLSNYNI